MCGICGAVGFDNAIQIVRKMNQAMIHRGPDSEGFLDSNSIALGVRRLKIIDLSAGDQPIFNEDKSLAIILNGEIYNYQELRITLECLGHTFSTNSDTEVIIHAYEQWDKECLQYLRGMFAFAIFDQRSISPNSKTNVKSHIILARDRMGIKPLYLWHRKNQLVFASEVRALISSGVPAKQLSLGGVYSYLAFGSVQEPLTIISQIYSISPASWVDFTIMENKLLFTSGKYWRPNDTKSKELNSDQTRECLLDTVSHHLISDVNLGSFLSGGLDSGSIVALQKLITGGNVFTFTLGFDNWPFDERKIAQITSDHLRTDHHLRVVSQAEVISDLPIAIKAMDQPTIDGINTWYISREAKRSGLTVALSGVGGDELFAGYPSFKYVPLMKSAQNICRWIPTNISAKLVYLLLHNNMDKNERLSDYLRGNQIVDHPYFAIRSLFPNKRLNQLLSKILMDMPHSFEEEKILWWKSIEEQLQIAHSYDAIGEVSWLELSQYMRSTLLRDTDMMSMAHSLEVRVPFVDHVLIDSILPISGDRKIHKNQHKPLLVDGVGDLLPAEVINHRKHTFTLPFQNWMKLELASNVEYQLSDYSIILSNWMDLSSVKEVWKDYKLGKTNWTRPWALYILDAWVRSYIE
jgi:asparagine synthase (glutamine-hydrolysing)